MNLLNVLLLSLILNLAAAQFAVAGSTLVVRGKAAVQFVQTTKSVFNLPSYFEFKDLRINCQHVVLKQTQQISDHCSLSNNHYSDPAVTWISHY